MTEDSQADSLRLMGRIWRAHGVRGDVKVIPETDDPHRFEDLHVVLTGRTASTAEPVQVEGVRFQPTKKGTIVILKLEGIDDRDAAEALRKTSVYARADDLPELDEDEFYIQDLLGLEAVREDGTVIGVVDDVLQLPGQETLVIGREGREPAMVPAVPEFVVDIDFEAGRVAIRPIEGLLEE